jgi:plasmid stability protein
MHAKEITMPSLQVRELPDPIYRKLAAEAEKEHRSLAQQAVAVLARGLGAADDARERRRRVLDQIQKAPIKTAGKKLPKPADLIREDRNR